MKRNLKIGLVTCGAIAIASAAVAAEYSNKGGNEGKTFYTAYTNGLSNYGSINVTSSDNRGGTLNWDNKNNTSANYVAGLGFGYDTARPTTMKYSIGSWTIDRSGSGAWGVYGWACNNVNKPGGGQYDNVEFYIVDAWLNSDAEYKPYDSNRMMKSGKQVEVVTTHGTYKIWQSARAYTRDNACPKVNNANKPFLQVWAVRTAKRSVGTTEVSVDFKKISEVMDDYGYFTPTLKYIVVGLDTSGYTQGKININTVNKVD